MGRRKNTQTRDQRNIEEVKKLCDDVSAMAMDVTMDTMEHPTLPQSQHASVTLVTTDADVEMDASEHKRIDDSPLVAQLTVVDEQVKKVEKQIEDQQQEIKDAADKLKNAISARDERLIDLYSDKEKQLRDERMMIVRVQLNRDAHVQGAFNTRTLCVWV
jgi:hypothetical protein